MQCCIGYDIAFLLLFRQPEIMFYFKTRGASKLPTLQRNIIKTAQQKCCAVIFLAPRPGLEPGTCGLTVRRSTD